MRWMALTTILLSAPALAEAPAGDLAADELLKRIQILEQRDQERERENAALRNEVDVLRAESGEKWLTEERANQIRGLVSDVLADADARTSLLRNGITAGWDHGFFLASPDGNYKLAIDGMLQFRWIYNFHDEPDRHRSGFENTRTKLTFRGNVVSPDISYLVRGNFVRRDINVAGDDSIPNPDPGGDFNLQDAWIRWDLNNQWNIKAGQFKAPFNREFLVASQYQLAVERSLVSQNLNIGRTQGVQLEWVNRDFRVDLMYSDGGYDQVGGDQDANLSNTQIPMNLAALAQDTEYAVTGRVEWKAAGNWSQFEDFTSWPDEEFGVLVGGAFHAQNGEATDVPSAVRNEIPWIAATLDVSAEFGGANLFASVTHHYFDRADGTNFRMWGFVVQGGVFVLPKWEVFARYEYGMWDFENDDTFTDLSLVTVGTNYYLKGHDLKLSADIGVGLDQIEVLWDSDIAGWREETDQANPQVVIRTQFQLLF